MEEALYRKALDAEHWLQAPLPNARAVPAHLVREVLSNGDAANVSQDILLAGTNIAAAALHDPNMRCSYRSFIHLLENLHKAAPPLTGLYRADREGVYGMFGYAMMACQNFAQAINIARRYYRTQGALFDLAVEAELPDELFAKVINRFRLPPHILAWATEHFFAGLPSLFRFLLGREVQPRRLELAYPEPSYVESYRKIFQCPLLFNAEYSRFVASTEILSWEVQQPSSDLVGIFEYSCQELLDEISGSTRLSNHIMRRLLNSPGMFPTTSEMASTLRMTEEALNLGLRQEETNYEQLLDEVKSRLSIEFLCATNMPVSEIHELLGFADIDSFHKSFTRWTGKTPDEFRQSEQRKS